MTDQPQPTPGRAMTMREIRDALGHTTPDQPEPTDQAALDTVRPHTLASIACHLATRADAILRPDSATYAEWQTVAAELRRLATDATA